MCRAKLPTCLYCLELAVRFIDLVRSESDAMPLRTAPITVPYRAIDSALCLGCCAPLWPVELTTSYPLARLIKQPDIAHNTGFPPEA